MISVILLIRLKQLTWNSHKQVMLGNRSSKLGSYKTNNSLYFVLEPSLVHRKAIVHIAFDSQINKETSDWNFKMQPKNTSTCLCSLHVSLIYIYSQKAHFHTEDNISFLLTIDFQLSICMETNMYIFNICKQILKRVSINPLTASGIVRMLTECKNK